MHFTKMQGLGNDYLYFYEEVPENVEELAIKLSDRHFGAGSDGLIYICPSQVADYKMRIFNADGSEAKMCGNGIRCVGKYIYDKGFSKKSTLKIETMSGIKTLELKVVDGSVEEVKVDMGKASYEDEKEVIAGSAKITVLPVSMGNPHVVSFVEDVLRVPLSSIGPLIEKHEMFPGGVNVEFVEVISEDELRMRVWERGSGITMACGTGTCSSVMAAIRKGFCKYNTPVLVHLDGGDLTIEIKEDDTVYMTGPARFVYEGDIQ